MDSTAGNLIGEICNIATNECQSVTLALNFPATNNDYSIAAQYWGVAFTSIILLYLFSHCIGLILKFVRNS